jgi:ethanolamine utilization microcompartment shell protein EutS
MHGNYEIDFKADPIQISFIDRYNGRITMKGSMSLDKLRQLIDCTIVIAPE